MNVQALRAALVSALALAATLPVAANVPSAGGERYPYGGPAFTRLLADSDRVAGAGAPQDFYRWVDRAPLSGRPTA